MIDETSARKGHRYVTVVLDVAHSHDLLLMLEGRSAEAVAEFVAAMPAHGAKAEAITEVVMDMSPAYSPGCKPTFPTPASSLISSPIMKLAGEAVDAVRKNLRKQGTDLTGVLWTLLGNQWTRSQEQLELRRTLARALREALQEVLADGDLPSIRWWLGWADCSRFRQARHIAAAPAELSPRPGITRRSDQLVDDILDEFLASASVLDRVWPAHRVFFQEGEILLARFDRRANATVPGRVTILQQFGQAAIGAICCRDLQAADEASIPPMCA
jgi:hypothetical protein